jgi:hypothetical protein
MRLLPMAVLASLMAATIAATVEKGDKESIAPASPLRRRLLVRFDAPCLRHGVFAIGGNNPQTKPFLQIGKSGVVGRRQNDIFHNVQQRQQLRSGFNND